MSAIDLTRITELNLTNTPVRTELPAKEIDLLELLHVLYLAKKQIVAGIVAFALMGLALASLLPQKWTSQAIVTTADTMQWQDIQQQIVKLQILGIDAKISRASVFELFIKKFQSRSLLEEYLASSPYIQAQLEGADINSAELHRAVVNLAAKMQSTSNQKSAATDGSNWLVWTLSFVAPTAQDAQAVLQGYIEYVSGIVEKETTQNLTNAVTVKILLEEGLLEQKRVHLENLRSANIERLNHALEIANAAGIKKPMYSSRLVAADDPDYQIMLGADGIEQKLTIEKSITDVAKLDADFNSEQHQLEQLRQIVIPDIHFEPFKYQLSPSLPVTKSSPSKSIIVMLAAALGGLLTCAGILLHRAMVSYRV